MRGFTNAVRWAAVGFLFFLGVSGVIGGIPMIADPHGSPWQMPQSLLQYSPFRSYLIPGIVLFIANGVLPLVICGMVLLRAGRGEILTAFQGSVLLGWIVVECIMIRTVAWPHYLYGALAVALIGCGVMLVRGLRDRAPERVFVVR